MAIYLFLFAVASGILLTLFMAGRSTSEATISSYLVSGNAEIALDRIRQDLRETALASLRPYPAEGGPADAPGVSMVSARAFADDKQGELLVNSHGAPQWDHYVFYTVQVPSGSLTGSLVRWEREMDDKGGLPIPATLLPSQIQGTHRSVLLQHVVAPNVTLDGVGKAGKIASTPFGGLRVQFVRRVGGEAGAEQLTTVSPSQGKAEDNTRLVEVEMQIYQTGGSHPSYFSIRFRVAPLY